MRGATSAAAGGASTNGTVPLWTGAINRSRTAFWVAASVDGGAARVAEQQAGDV